MSGGGRSPRARARASDQRLVDALAAMDEGAEAGRDLDPGVDLDPELIPQLRQAQALLGFCRLRLARRQPRRGRDVRAGTQV